MTGWREALGVPVFIEGEINSRISLCVLLRRQWGILTADEKKSETHPTASIRLDSRDMKSNFSKEFICFSLPNALEMITYVWMVHWMFPAKNWDIGRILGTLDSWSLGELQGRSVAPGGLTCPGLQWPSCDTGRRSLCPHPATTGTPHISEGGDINTPHTHSLLFFPFNFIYSFFFFGCFQVFVAMWAPSICAEQGLLSSCAARASHCGGFSCCRALALGCMDFSNHGTQALLLWSMWNLLGLGMEPMSPALAGEFLSSGPPGKSRLYSFLITKRLLPTPSLFRTPWLLKVSN